MNAQFVPDFLSGNAQFVSDWTTGGQLYEGTLFFSVDYGFLQSGNVFAMAATDVACILTAFHGGEGSSVGSIEMSYDSSSLFQSFFYTLSEILLNKRLESGISGESSSNPLISLEEKNFISNFAEVSSVSNVDTALIFSLLFSTGRWSEVEIFLLSQQLLSFSGRAESTAVTNIDLKTLIDLFSQVDTSLTVNIQGDFSVSSSGLVSIVQTLATALSYVANLDSVRILEVSLNLSPILSTAFDSFSQMFAGVFVDSIFALSVVAQAIALSSLDTMVISGVSISGSKISVILKLPEGTTFVVEMEINRYIVEKEKTRYTIHGKE